MTSQFTALNVLTNGNVTLLVHRSPVALAWSVKSKCEYTQVTNSAFSPSLLSQQPICTQIANGTLTDLNVRSIVVFPSSVHLLTNDWLVYSLNRDAIADPHVMQFNATEQPFNTKWPAFANQSTELGAYFEANKKDTTAIYGLTNTRPVLYVQFKDADIKVRNKRKSKI